MQYIGKETTIEVGGKSYRLGRFDRGTWRAVLDEVDKHLPNVLDQLAKIVDKLPKEMAERAVEKALDDAKRARSMNSPEVADWVNSPEGIAFVLIRLIHNHHPELTEEDIWALMMDCIQEHGSEYLGERLAQAQGVNPEKKG